MWPAIVGGLISGGLSYLGQRNANVANAQQAAMNREFQEDMSGTAYQRATEDMKAAGLNPMLAYSQGGAKGTPGAQAVMQSDLGAAVNSGQTGAMIDATIQKVRAETGKAEADTKLSESQALINAVQVPKVEQETKTSAFSAANLDTQSRLMGQQAVKVMAEVEKIGYDTDLSRAQIQKVKEETLNAIKEGRRIDASTGNLRADTALTNLELPRARNIAGAQKSWYMREISPYVPDFVKGAGSAAALRYSTRPDYEPQRRRR